MYGIGLRTPWALLVMLIVALGIYLLTGSVQAALVALVGGCAAVLVAAGGGDQPEITLVDEPETPSGEPALQDTLDAIIEPVLIVGDGRVTIANRAACALLGSHVVGEDVRVAIRHPAAAARLSTDDTTVSDRPIDLVGLGTLDQRWQMRVGRAGNGNRIVHLIDQTGNYAAERMRVDFVANASHELRTPLASILGFIETLADEAGESPALRTRFLKVMNDEARRMQRLVEDLISLSRIEAEKYRLPATAIDLADLTHDVHRELAATGSPRGADVVATIEAGVPPIAGDSAQLSQMLHNLIGNAMKYGRSGTPVNVRLRRDDAGMVRLSISDEGDGIAPEHIPRLTERFYRVDAGRSRALGGTGLGLAIVKHIVERHRGRLDIVSQIGVGTTFTVLLPPAEALSSKRNTIVTEPHR